MIAGSEVSFYERMRLLLVKTLPACRFWIGFVVVDRSHTAVGTLRSLWTHAGTAHVQFFGVQTAGSAARDLLVPAEGVEVDAGRRRIRLPYARAWILQAPAYAACAELTPARKGEIYLHYDVQAALRPQSGTLSR